MVVAVIAVFAPGQGSQTPGMLAPWLELPGVADQLGAFSEVSRPRPGPARHHAPTPTRSRTPPSPSRCSSRSARSPPGSSASTSATERGRRRPQRRRADRRRGGRRAVRRPRRSRSPPAAAPRWPPPARSPRPACPRVLGGDPDEVLAAIEAAGLTPANRNGAGQIVAAGALDALEKLAAEPPAGARVRPLPVAGAFHTHYMAPGRARAAAPTPRELRAGRPAPDPAVQRRRRRGDAPAPELIARLVAQVTLPVRWDLCLRTCATSASPPSSSSPRRHAGRHRQAGAAGRRDGRREDPGRPRRPPADRQPPQHGQGEHTPSPIVVPRQGHLHPAEASTRAARGRDAPRHRPHQPRRARDRRPGGVLAEWLRHDGDIVAAGLPLARIHGSETDAPSPASRRHPHPRAGPLPPGQRDHQRRPHRPRRRHQRRVDQDPGRHRRARWADPDETVADMAESAASKALAATGVSADDVDFVIVATCTMPDAGPGGRAALAHAARHRRARRLRHQLRLLRLRLRVDAASAAIRAGQARNVLVVAVRAVLRLARHDRPQRRASSSPTAPAPPWSARPTTVGIGPVVWGSDGAQFDTRRHRRATRASSGRRARRSTAGPPRRWRRSRSRPADRAGVDPTELAAFVPHQANLRIIDALAKRLGATERRRRPRHRHVRQHLGGEHPARAVAHGRARRDPVRRAGAAARLRLRPGLRRPGRARPLNVRVAHRGRRPTPTRRESLTVASADEIRAGLAEILNEVADVDPDDVPTRSPSSTTSTSTRCRWSRSRWPPRRSSASRSRTTSCPSSRPSATP